MKKWLLLLLFHVLMFATAGHTQVYELAPAPFQVRRINTTIQFPFLGGLNSPKIQLTDLNRDNFLDLIVLESGAEVLSFLTDGSNAWQYRPSEAWDGLMQDWLLLEDVNGDDLPDLLTADGLGGVFLFENTGIDDLWFINNGTKDPALRAEPGSQPALFDVDYDGDQDFFGGNSVGTISFFRNAGGPARPAWQFETSKFGGITVLLDTVLIESATTKSAHGASAVQIFDYENDGAPDIFFGDFFSQGIYHLRNLGNAGNPRFEVATEAFPANDPVQSLGFNQVVFAAIDSLPDLFVSVAFPAAAVDNLMHYRNSGARRQPRFQLVTKNLLSTIDAGKRSHIGWADFNTDGLADFILGGERGGIAAYQRDDASSFHWVSDNWLPQAANLTGLAPTLVDLNDDGLLDAVMGLFEGTLRAYRNNGLPEIPLFVEDNSLVPADDFGSFAAPAFGDIDRDGDQDLVVGAVYGKITFLKNIGTAQSPSFSRTTTSLDDLIVESFAAPLLADWNLDGKLDLLIGSGAGIIRIFFQNNLTEFSFSTTPSVEIRTKIRSLAPGFLVTRRNGRHDLIAGCERGGIVYLRASDEVDPTPSTMRALRAHPNPTRNKITLRAASALSDLEVFDILGRRVLRERNLNSLAWILDTSDLPTGIYIVRANTAFGEAIAKFVKLR
jgi:hypothetical protein